ncbi:protein kinase domain-containing protein [Egbenema bharatensis]|uniref:protein kinase domain-containing protein n=1 Tax=Egbenema bharatensis TaxID=3463334 RepID=UPI003A8B3C14
MNFFKRFQSTATGLTIGGRYRLVNQLGVGGFSQTFLAEDLHLPGHPKCVVKQLKPQVTDERHLQTARRLFDTEARVLYQLGNHDQIPRLLAHFMDGEEFFLVQELIEGEPLTKKLASGFPWAEKRVMELLYDLMTVLEFVHGQNVIHRDIKPSNLICRTDGKIVLIDFGAVKQVGQTQTDSRVGQTQTVSVGTQGYMPAEQLGGHPRFSSDIYAAGMVGIQALTGTHPKQIDRHPHTGEVDWRNHRMEGRSLPALRVSSGLATILDRMVCYHFKDRYQRVTEVLQDLSDLMAQQPEQPEDELSADTVILPPVALSEPSVEPTQFDQTEIETTPSDQVALPIVLEASSLADDDPSEPYITALFPQSPPHLTHPPSQLSVKIVLNLVI